jgi:hypothetical protein
MSYLKILSICFSLSVDEEKFAHQLSIVRFLANREVDSDIRRMS